jgi:hypothetical protein
MENGKTPPNITGPQDGQNVSVGGPGPHAPPDFHESFYVIDGEIEVRSEAGTYIAGKGSVVHIPTGGIVHCFKNKTDQIAHLLCTVAPSGLEEFFAEIGRPVALGAFLRPPDGEAMKKIIPITEKYGQKLFPPDFLG